MACPLPGHQGGQEVLWLGHRLVMPRPDQSFPGSWIYIRHSVNVTCKLWFFALFCTCDICCMSVCPGRGIPPLWLFLRFLPSFFYPVKRVIFFHQHGKFFLTQIQGLRTEDVVHCTDCKAHWLNVIVILGYINKFDLIWYRFWTVKCLAQLISVTITD